MAPTAPAGQTRLESALALLREAINQLDEANAPGHIAAHVDLAAAQLEAVLAPRQKFDPD